MNSIDGKRAAKNVILLGVGHTIELVVKQWATHTIEGCQLARASKFPTASCSRMLPDRLDWRYDSELRDNLENQATPHFPNTGKFYQDHVCHVQGNIPLSAVAVL